MATNVTVVSEASFVHSLFEIGKDSQLGGGTQRVNAHSWVVLL